MQLNKRTTISLEGVPASLNDVAVIRAAIKRAKVKIPGVELSIFSDVPEASGLGGSASMTVSIVYGLSVLSEVPISLYEVAERAQRAEADLGMLNGYQDWYAAAFGGLLFLDFREKNNNPIEEEPYATVEDLSPYMKKMKLVVADTRIRHNSALSNEVLYRRYIGKDRKVVSLVNRLDMITREAKKAVVHEDMEKLSGIVKENQEIIRKFGRSIPENEQLIDAAYRAGALACKVTGAGQGGCIVAVCSGRRNQYTIRDALLEETDAVFPVELDRGVRAEFKEK